MPTGPASRLMPTLRRVVLAGTVNDRTDGQLLGAFVVDRDADAFAGLVRRHGPMVLGVCRRVTGDHTTADDAFQAVFLVLARRAGAIKPREQVGNWLYGVAYRTAIKARAVQARRRSREKQVDVMPEPPVTSPPDVWSDLQPVIDEELARLPDKLRIPVVLCDLEGRTQREVAKHLGVPPATLATRLATARRTLAQQLTRRGVTLSGGALAGLLTAHGTVAAVSHRLACGLAQVAEAVANGGIATSLVSAHAIQLSEGVIRMMLLTKLKALAVVVLTAVALTGGLGLGLVPATASDDPAQTQTDKPAVAATTPANNPSANPGAKQPSNVVRTERNFDNEAVDDLTFLRRLTLDLRGTPPTNVESWFFVADEDVNKRAKVVGWMTEWNLKDTIDGQIVRTWNLTTIADGNKVRLWDAKTGKAPDGQNPTVPTIERLREAFGEKCLEQEPAFYPTQLEFHNGETRVVSVNEHDNWLKIPLRKALQTWLTINHDDKPGIIVDGELLFNELSVQLEPPASTNSDATFLKRVVLDVRGTAPTTLEEKYFTEDKDPKKREKLLDTLLKDPAVAKKLGDEWKKKMLTAPKTAEGKESHFELWLDSNQLKIERLRVPPPELRFHYVFPEQEFKILPSSPTTQPQAPVTPKVANPPVPPQPPKPPQPPTAPQPTRLEKLVSELLGAKKSDAEMLEAVTLATVGRLPTDAEKRLTLGLVVKTTDRKAAWIEVAKALAATEEGTKHGGTEVHFVGPGSAHFAPKVIEFIVPAAKP